MAVCAKLMLMSVAKRIIFTCFIFSSFDGLKVGRRAGKGFRFIAGIRLIFYRNKTAT